MNSHVIVVVTGMNGHVWNSLYSNRCEWSCDRCEWSCDRYVKYSVWYTLAGASLMFGHVV